MLAAAIPGDQDEQGTPDPRHDFADRLRAGEPAGLESLTIGSLATTCEMSKSGLFAHFQSRDNLQIAVLTYSAEVFRERVIQPVRQQQHQTQQEKLIALLQAWLAWEPELCRPLHVPSMPGPRPREGRGAAAARQLVRFWLDYLARQGGAGTGQGSGAAIRIPGAPVYRLYGLYLGIRCSTPWRSARSGPPLLAGGGPPCWPVGAEVRSALLLKTDKKARPFGTQNHRTIMSSKIYFLTPAASARSKLLLGLRHPVASRTGPAHAKRTASKLLLTLPQRPTREVAAPAGLVQQAIHTGEGT